ncbi:O-methyltransferase MdmC-like [Lytechinus pictus]|uniref:O-methyltransferase MdmC-like n=1 Tax=Lytechinus pictus TaxID=7653 RepID=UPI0030BA0A1C
MSVDTGALPPKATKGNEDIADTPIEFLIEFLTQLKATSENAPEATRTLVNQSLELASGLLTYPLTMSSGVSRDAQLLANETKAIDFEVLYNEGKTGSFKFFKEMSSNLLQGQILKMMVRMTGAKKVLEIGTFTGFAALNMAEGLPSDGKLVTMELLPFFAQFARDFFSRTATGSKITVQEGSAIDLLKNLAEKRESFDLIFIDAAKKEYKDYLQVILDSNILAPGGTMLFDNTIFKGATFMENFPNAAFARGGPAVHNFNKILQNETRVEQVVLPISDGVTIVRRIGE